VRRRKSERECIVRQRLLGEKCRSALALLRRGSKWSSDAVCVPTQAVTSAKTRRPCMCVRPACVYLLSHGERFSGKQRSLTRVLPFCVSGTRRTPAPCTRPQGAPLASHRAPCYATAQHQADMHIHMRVRLRCFVAGA